MSIPNTNVINGYIHCANCFEEDVPQKLAVGWTALGVQVWCEFCDCNVCHIDFEGATHPANTTREK